MKTEQEQASPPARNPPSDGAFDPSLASAAEQGASLAAAPSPALVWPPRAAALELGDKVARHAHEPVLIRGARGTPLEELAQHIHQRGSGGSTFVSVRCRGVSEERLHVELFGSGDPTAPGASAVARARGGTLFVEEATLLGVETQRRMVDLLEVPVEGAPGDGLPARIVMATCADVERAVRERRARADLFERLAVVTIHVPALGEAPNDIASLAQSCLDAACARLGRPPAQLTAGAIDKLAHHAWPGNDRELEAVIGRALITEAGSEIPPEAIGFVDPSLAPDDLDDGARVFVMPRAENGRPATLEDIERAYVKWVLGITRGNRTAASRLLGISYPTMMKKITDYQIDYRALALETRPKN